MRHLTIVFLLLISFSDANAKGQFNTNAYWKAQFQTVIVNANDAELDQIANLYFAWVDTVSTVDSCIRNAYISAWGSTYCNLAFGGLLTWKFARSIVGNQNSLRKSDCTHQWMTMPANTLIAAGYADGHTTPSLSFKVDCGNAINMNRAWPTPGYTPLPGGTPAPTHGTGGTPIATGGTGCCGGVTVMPIYIPMNPAAATPTPPAAPTCPHCHYPTADCGGACMGHDVVVVETKDIDISFGLNIGGNNGFGFGGGPFIGGGPVFYGNNFPYSHIGANYLWQDALYGSTAYPAGYFPQQQPQFTESLIDLQQIGARQSRSGGHGTPGPKGG